MERGGRRAFGTICPNTVRGPPARGHKKPARPGGVAAGTPPAPPEPPPRPPRGPLVLTTIDWKDLAACTPVLPSTPTGPVAPQQDPCFQDGQEFDFQEFTDVVDDFISEAPPATPPALDCADFDFSLGEEGSFGPRSPQLERSPHLPPQRLPSPPRWWDAHQRALGDALEANSQLQDTLAQRQRELVALRESNAQLKELASQARQLAAVLETLMIPQDANREALRPPPPPPPHPPAAAGVPVGACGAGGRPEPPCVDAMLREVSERCRAALQSLGGDPGGSRGGGPGGSPSAKRPRGAPQGAFRGERGGRPVPSPAQAEEGGVLRAALGQPGGIRTLAFPQGSAFTLRSGGGYRFRWVPR